MSNPLDRLSRRLSRRCRGCGRRRLLTGLGWLASSSGESGWICPRCYTEGARP
jgi:hypothetical protein